MYRKKKINVVVIEAASAYNGSKFQQAGTRKCLTLLSASRESSLPVSASLVSIFHRCHSLGSPQGALLPPRTWRCCKAAAQCSCKMSLAETPVAQMGPIYLLHRSYSRIVKYRWPVIHVSTFLWLKLLLPPDAWAHIVFPVILSIINHGKKRKDIKYLKVWFGSYYWLNGS